MPLRVRLGPESVGERADRAIVAALGRAGVGCTRSQLARSFEQGLVRAENKRLRPGSKVGAPMDVEVVIVAPPPLSAQAEPIALDIVYEDEHLLVLNKQAKMTVHPGPGHPGGTVVNAVLHHLGVPPEELPLLPGNPDHRPGIVHRIDRDTSGLLVVARHAQAQEGLAVQFREHSIERRYVGFVRGVPSWKKRRVETLHGRDAADRRRYSAAVTRGRRAVTEAEVLETYASAAMLGFRLETGRTHQIRMHVSHLGHPIVADELYGRRRGRNWLSDVASRLGRHALHASVLGFDHPVTGERRRFECALPQDLETLRKTLRAGPDPSGPT